MAEYWLNRITGESRSSQPDGDPLGIWVNSSNAHWVGCGDEAVGVSKDVLPASTLTDGVVRVSQNLQEVGVKQWIDWCHSLPIDMQLAEPPKLREEEKVLHSAIQHFEEIARLPRAHLKVDEVRVPVGRARRFPPRALNVLSAHSEDWHSRSFSSVRPNRVLSEVQDDDFAIYENRALKTLQQRLLSALAPRLATLRSLRDALDASDLNPSGGRRFSINRLCELLYDLFTDDPNRPALDALIENLESLRLRLLSLEGMFLFKEIKFATRVLSPLQATNILRDDSHYRHVFRVWMAWETRSKKKITRKEKLLRYPLAFDQFTSLLCVKALNLIGVNTKGSDSYEFYPGASSIALKHNWFLTWSANGTLTFEHQEKTSSLHIIGSPAQLSKLSISTVKRLVSQIESKVAKGGSVLFVTLSHKESLPESWPDNLKNKLNVWRTIPPNVPACFLVEVSAVRLDSIELIARVFRRVMAEHDWPILPIPISVDEKISAQLPEFSKDIVNQWIQPPAKSLLNRLKQSRDNSESELKQLKEKLEQAQMDERATRSRKQKGKNGVNYNQLKHDLREAILEQEEKTNILNGTFDKIQKVEQKFLPVLDCPCCGHTTTNPPVGSAFTCSSDSCKTEWGRHQSRSIFLRPDGDDPTKTKGDPIQMFGADYISVDFVL